jgi:uncharacterized membrane protein YfcA
MNEKNFTAGRRRVSGDSLTDLLKPRSDTNSDSEKKAKGKLYFAIAGVIIGIINGLFGSGGGVAAVPALQNSGIAVKKAHATSLAVTLPLSIVSAVFYSVNSEFKWSDALILIPFGLAGAVIGGLLLKKLKNVWLKRIFGALLIVAGIRMLF